MTIAARAPNPLPDIGDIVFVLVFALLIFTMPDFLFNDGSTGWHLVAGQFILSTHTIPHHDLISYTFAGKPWVAYEWLSDLTMALVDRLAGLNGLAVLFASAISLLFLLLYERMRKAGSHFVISLSVCVVGVLAASVHFLARPHVFTFLMVYVFSTMLESFHRNATTAKRLLWAAPLWMLLWVNMHPAFLLAFVMMAIYLVSELLGQWLVAPGERGSYRSRAGTLMIALTLTFAASLVNPYGGSLYAYIASYLKSGRVLSMTDEYLPPIFHGALQPTCLELLLLLLVVGLVVSKVRPSMPQLMTVLLFAHLALASTRNSPLFVIVVLPFIAELLADTRWLRADVPVHESAAWLRRCSVWWNDLGRRFGEQESLCQMHIVPAVTVVLFAAIALGGGKLCGRSLLSSSFDPANKPTETLLYIHNHHLPANRGLSFDNWGGYIRYRAGIPVFIDDRADFYGEQFYLQYAEMSMVKPDWEEVLRRHHIDWVLFPKDSALSAALRGTSEWKLVSEDRASCLFMRDPAADHSAERS